MQLEHPLQKTQRRPIRVMCVDDNFLVAEAIRIKLSLSGDFEWVGHLSCADTLAEEALRARPDILLLDIDMPGKDVFTALEELGEAGSPARAIMISGHIRGELIDRAVNAGAWGYLSKGGEADTIVSSIRQVMDGEFVLDRDAAAAFRGR
jgi:two-component system, NarL family, response regulator DesR